MIPKTHADYHAIMVLQRRVDFLKMQARGELAKHEAEGEENAMLMSAKAAAIEGTIERLRKRGAE